MKIDYQKIVSNFSEKYLKKVIAELHDNTEALDSKFKKLEPDAANYTPNFTSIAAILKRYFYYRAFLMTADQSFLRLK